MRSSICLVVWLLNVGTGIAQDRVNLGAALDAALQDRVAAYVKLRDGVEQGLPPASADKGQELAARQQELANRVRAARPNAKQGDILSPDIAAELRRLISLAMQGANSTRVNRSISSSERGATSPLVINGSLSESLPMPSVPPTLLLNLPRLTGDVDYRIVGSSLVLHDMKAGIIIDFVPGALPAPK